METTLSNTVKALAQELDVKRLELKAIYDKAATGQVDPDTGASLYNPEVMTTSVIEEVQKRHAELAEINQKYERARLSEIEAKNADELNRLSQVERRIVPGIFAPGGSDNANLRGMNGNRRTLADMVINHPAYKTRSSSRGRFHIEFEDVDVKTLLQESTGYAPVNARTDTVIPFANRRPVVGDLIPTDPTTNQIIKWMEETTFSNQASTVAEGGLKPESALAFTERSSTVQKIATWIPVTEEQIDDVPALAGIINRDLALMIALQEEIQLLNGSGTGTNLLGFLQAPNIQSQAFSTNNADTVFLGMQKVRWTGFAEPSGVVLHPDNWSTIRLAKTTGSGEYILGAPSPAAGTGAVTFPYVDVLWGKPVIITPAITSGTGLTGDFLMYAHISRRMGLRIDVSDSHDVYFIYNKLAVRAEIRESLEIRRQAAFCKLTSLT
jgi:HK97 family phage major capsid protein